MSRLSLLVAMASAKRDVVLRRFRVREARDRDDLAAAGEVLEAVRRVELNRVTGGSVVDSSAFDGVAAGRRTFVVRDRRDGRAVGCMLATPAARLVDVEASRAEYRLGVVPRDLLDEMVVMTRLALLPAYRGTVASLSLIADGLVLLVADGYTTSLMTCEPALVAMYRRLGARPLGPAHPSPAGGFRVPMICIPDPGHLAAVGSPLRAALTRSGATARHHAVSEWYAELVATQGAIHTGVVPFDPDGDGAADLAQLTAGLTERGVAQLMRSAQVVTCAAGDVVVATEDGGRSLGLVRDGAVAVRLRGTTIAVLGVGEVFGEIATILDRGRTADVIALADPSEVVLLTRSALDRVTDAADRAALWRNLARIVALRLAAEDEG